MAKYILQRFLLLFPALLLANFAGFAYAYLARTGAGNPFFAAHQPGDTLWPQYTAYAQGLLSGSLGPPPGAFGSFAETIRLAGLASLGLFVITLLVSVVGGFALGLLGVRTSPPGVRPWLTWLSTIGLATPSFFIGTLAVALLLIALVRGPLSQMPLPLSGFGWDAHLVLPVLALAVRPTAQIAQMLAGLIAGELRQPYLDTARGKGLSRRAVIRRHALPNVWAPLAQTVAGAVRLLVGEQILVEWLFGWPGLGRLMAQTLIPPGANAAVFNSFMDPPLVATLLTLIAAVLLVADAAAAATARYFDPRQRTA